MSLKAKIKNLAKSKDMSEQVVLQNYMFERFLERISKYEYKNKFILKGYPLNEESLSRAINNICSIDVDLK